MLFSSASLYIPLVTLVSAIDFWFTKNIAGRYSQLTAES